MKTLFESILSYVFEKHNINFGTANPKYGQCVILGGGPGSGKGFVQSKVLGNFKTVDVDKMKELYIKNAKRYGDDYEYDLSKPEDVSKLHEIVKKRGWKKAVKHHYNKQRSSDKDLADANYTDIVSKLPNICWDMVSDDPKDVAEIATEAKLMGYNVTFIWVVCNLESAKEGNKSRARRVDEKTILIPKHEACAKVIPNMLMGKDDSGAVEFIDNAWIGFSAGYKRKLDGRFEKKPVIKLKKQSSGIFNYKEEAMSLVYRFLSEQQPYMTDEEWAEEQRKKANTSSYKDWASTFKELGMHTDVAD